MNKKQYSFRLKNTNIDEELSHFIFNLTKQYKNESEAIRQLLLLAMRYHTEHMQNNMVKQIQQELIKIKGTLEQNHSELLELFESGSYALQEVSNSDAEDSNDSNQVAQETATALLSGFGVDF